MDAHSQKRKKNYKKEKSRYNGTFLVAADQTPTEIHLLQKRRLQEENSAQAPSSTDSRSGRSSWTDPVPLDLLPRSEANHAVPVDCAGSGCGQQIGGHGPDKGECAGVQMLLRFGRHSQPRGPGWTNRLWLGCALPNRTPCPAWMSALEQSVHKYAEDTQWRHRPRSRVKQASTHSEGVVPSLRWLLAILSSAA